MRQWATVFAFGLATLASACSGPRTQELILYNSATTLISAGLSMILTFFAFTRRLPTARYVCLGLLVIHPAWTMITFCCDCGMTQMSAAVLDGILSTGVFIWDFTRRRVR